MILCVSPARRSRRSRLAPTGRQPGPTVIRDVAVNVAFRLRPPSSRHHGPLRYPDRKGPMCSATQGHTALPLSRSQLQFTLQHRPYAHPTPVVKENPPRLSSTRNPMGRRVIRDVVIRDVVSFVSLLLPRTRLPVPQPPRAPAGVCRGSCRIGHRAASSPPYGTPFFTSVPDREPKAAFHAIRSLEPKGCRVPPFAEPMPGAYPGKLFSEPTGPQITKEGLRQIGMTIRLEGRVGHEWPEDLPSRHRRRGRCHRARVSEG